MQKATTCITRKRIAGIGLSTVIGVTFIGGAVLGLKDKMSATLNKVSSTMGDGPSVADVANDLSSSAAESNGGVAQPVVAASGSPQDVVRASGTASSPAAKSSQIKSVNLTLSIDSAKYPEVNGKVPSIATSVGGFVESSSERSEPLNDPSGNGRKMRISWFVIRVPNERFDETRKNMANLGEVTNQKLSGQEVSAQIVDIEARLASLTLQEEAYKKLFDQANGVNEIVAVQDQVTKVRTQIETITAQREALKSQVAYSTVTVTLRENLPLLVAPAPPVVEPTPKIKPITFANKASRAWRGGVGALLSILTALAVVVITVAPLLPLVGMVLAILLVARRVVRRRRARNDERTQRRFAPSATQHPEAHSEESHVEQDFATTGTK
jgi:Domain of unknown function (DUF4349)